MEDLETNSVALVSCDEEEIPLGYRDMTTSREREFDNENLFLSNPAVFPELPEPFNNLYMRVRNLNEDNSLSKNEREFSNDIDKPVVSSVEVGIKFSL